ncbi:MAG: hypothetical protein HRT94_00915 [Alphaproteobacteria bacterium]|nr:hypothetical protein [Alphaproteobacteria bacterium]
MIKLIRFIIGIAVLVVMYHAQKPLWDAGVYTGEYWEDVEGDYEDDGGDNYAYDDYDTESDW